MENSAIDVGTVKIVIGKSFSMSGVNDIRGFDEGIVVLDTQSGRVNIEGKDLKIESLSKEDGKILVSGNVQGVYLYTQENKKRGFFARLFG